MRFTLCKAQPVRQGQTTTSGTTCPSLFDKCVGSEDAGDGPTVYSPYPRILERLTICRCNCKGSTFSSYYFKILSVGKMQNHTPCPH